MSLLRIENLSIRFGETTVVNEVSLEVAAGEVLALVGESGSGKSLTAHSILQLLPASASVSGRITLGGEPQSPATLCTWRGARVGMIFQEPMTSLNPLHPIHTQMIEGFCWHQRLRPSHPRAQTKLAELFAAVGLNHLAHRGAVYPHQLSGGERQRVMIAMAIANDPEWLIADEPTTALDVTLQGQILELLKDLQTTRRMGMIFITHDLLTVRRIADRVAVMHQGKIVESRTTSELFHSPREAYTTMLLAAAPSGAPAPLAPDAATVISTPDLSVHFPIKTGLLRRVTSVVKAVEHVALTLHAGETLGVVGESGSGKSSLGYALLRLTPSIGPIVFLGERLDQMKKEAIRANRSDMQLVFQDPYSSLNPRMSIGEIVAEGLTLHGVMQGGETLRKKALSPATIAQQVDAILLQVGLTPDMKTRYPHEFSGGQRQRIAIARAMVLKPRLVILDEPTSALDMSVQRQVLELLKTLQASHQVAYVLISHDLRVIRAMAHQVLVLKKGAVVEHGPAEQIFFGAQQKYTAALISAAGI